jgi:hypothetical protein
MVLSSIMQDSGMRLAAATEVYAESFLIGLQAAQRVIYVLEVSPQALKCSFGLKQVTANVDPAML